MRFRLRRLLLALRRGEVVIPFDEVSYFWGRMGAGKTSSARLVDYCLGGSFELSPALQTEFVSATLELSLDGGDLSIERPRDSDRVIASWGEGDRAFQASLPARVAAGEAVPGTGVEQLSDLLFWLSGIRPPRVRKSRAKEDSETARLSVRDLLWYCYLDQDEIDSSFFHLEDGAAYFRRNKSRDVLRYVIGFHDERVSELEADLDQLRGERQALNGSLTSLVRVLKEVWVQSKEQILDRVGELRARADEIEAEIVEGRNAASAERQVTHAVDGLQEDPAFTGQEHGDAQQALVGLVADRLRPVRREAAQPVLDVDQHRGAVRCRPAARPQVRLDSLAQHALLDVLEQGRVQVRATLDVLEKVVLGGEFARPHVVRLIIEAAGPELLDQHVGVPPRPHEDELVHNVEHPDLATVVGAVLHEIVGPHVIAVLGAQANA